MQHSVPFTLSWEKFLYRTTEQNEEIYVVKSSLANSISYKNKYGNLHRNDNPAFIAFKNIPNAKEPYKFIWFQNGIKHREDGPAYVDILAGKRFWSIYGKVFLSEEQFLKFQKDKIVYINKKPYLLDGRIIKEH